MTAEPDFDDPIFEIRYAIKRQHDESRRIRALILEQVESGVSQRELARRLGMSHGTMNHWISAARADRDGVESTRKPRQPYGSLR